MSFAQRIISLTVQLASNTQTNQPNTFAENGADTVTITNSRMSVRIQNSGAAVNGSATVKVWGLTPSLMNQLATLGLVLNLVPKNILTIQAGTVVNGIPNLSTVFTGTIWAGYGDYESQPDVPFIFECLSGGNGQTLNVPPSSFPGSTQVSNMMEGFARQLNAGFTNNGVSLSLSNAYFTGSPMTQAQKCADAAPCWWGIFSNTLEIWPRGGNRNTPNIPVIQPPSIGGGMITSPAFTQQGIIVKTLFDPTISFGSLVTVRSSVLSGISQVQQQNATGGASGVATAPTFPSQWAVNKLDLALDCLLPKGQWMSTVYAYNPGYSKTIIAPGS